MAQTKSRTAKGGSKRKTPSKRPGREERTSRGGDRDRDRDRDQDRDRGRDRDRGGSRGGGRSSGRGGKSEFVRLTSLFKCKSGGRVGTVRDKYLDNLVDLVDKAVDQGKGVAFFLKQWGRDEEPVLSATIAQDYDKGGRGGGRSGGGGGGGRSGGRSGRYRDDYGDDPDGGDDYDL